MSFARPDLLVLAALLPLLAAVAMWGYARRRSRVARALGDPLLVARLGGGDLHRFPSRRLVLLVLAAAALGIAAAGPRWGRRPAEEQASALNIVLALDISKSMLAADVTPNRLERERIFVRRLLASMSGDRLGMVVFAGRAYVLSPLTVDHSALNLYLDALEPEIVSQGGSSVAAAIAQATDLARGSDQAGGDRAVLLVSDGEALEERADVRAVAERAARANVRIFTVGIGTPQGAPVPERDPQTGEVLGYKREPGNDEVVVSRLDERLLRDVAETTGGRYVNLMQAGAMDEILSALRGMERTAIEGGRRVEQPERFAIFVAIALLLLALDAAWPILVERREMRAGRSRLNGHTAVSPPDSSDGPVPRTQKILGARRGARAMQQALLFALVLGTQGFGPGDLERGNRLYREGRFEEAVQAYQAALRDGNGSPQLRYNLGTALLRLGRHEEAEEQLRLALDDVDADLRQRAYYNLGNRYLEAARSAEDAQQQTQLLDAAVESYKRALRLRPDDSDAKWNLELALREREEPPPQPQPQQGQGEPQEQDESQDQPQSGGGSSGGESDRDPGQDRGGSSDRMSQEQADRILSAIEQDERDLTREKLRRGQRRTPVARDW